MNEFSEEQIKCLTESVASSMSEKRFKHTEEVAKMVARLCDIYCPEEKNIMYVAGLLHDITKEWSTEKQIAYLQKKGENVTKSDIHAPKTFHARTAVHWIREQYPQYAVDEILLSIRYHTTGRIGMTLTEKLLYFADYIDLSRTYPNCVTLRELFFRAKPEEMTETERLRHLDKLIVLSFDMTIRDLLADGLPISFDTTNARNDIILKLTEKTND